MAGAFSYFRGTSKKEQPAEENHVQDDIKEDIDTVSGHPDISQVNNVEELNEILFEVGA